jgi:tetratricopeptide (TPR) repeat protein
MTDAATSLPPLPPPPPDSIVEARVLTTILGGPTAESTFAPPGYEIVHRLGSGAMGAVFLARHVRLNRFVALKMLRCRDTGSRALLSSEAGAIARLQHPNIVQIFEVGETAEGPFLALEYVDGGSLQDRLATTPPAPAEAAGLIQTVARAVHHAHERGLVHQDLKPANILISGFGVRGLGFGQAEVRNHIPGVTEGLNPKPESLVPKVADFGLARDLSAATTRGVVGTPGYMAPEQAGAGGEITVRTDVYSLGAVLYECLTGRPPFAESTAEETLASVREREPIPVRQVRPTTPRDLAAVCETCLQKDPVLRYASAADVADDLARYRRGEPIAARPVGKLERAWKWACRRPVVATLAAVSTAALVTVMLGGAVYQSRLREANRIALRNEARSKTNYRRALAAVEQLLTRVGGDRLVNVPEADAVRADLLRDALRFYDGFLADADDPDPALRREVAQAHLRVAVIDQALGRPDEATTHFNEAIDRTAALADEAPERTEFRDELADARRQYGEFLAHWTNPRRAAEEFDSARAIWLALAAADPADGHYPARVALCDHLIGWWHDSVGRTADAESAYRRALAGRETAVARDPSAENRRDLAMTLHNIAVVYSRTGRQNTAIAHESEAAGLFELLTQADPTDHDARGRWSAGLHNLGVLHSTAGHAGEARRCYEQALALREDIARAHPLVPAIQAALAETCNALAAEDVGALRRNDTEPLARRAVDLYERLVQQYPQNSGYAESLLGCLTNLAVIHTTAKRPADAATVYERALSIAGRLVREQPANPHFATAVAAVCLNRGNLEDVRGRPADALPWYERCLQAADDALAKDGSLADAQTWRLYAHGGRAKTYEALQDYAAAVRDWDRVVELSPETDRRDYRLMRTTSLARSGALGRLEAELGDLSTAADATAMQQLAEACAAAARAGDSGRDDKWKQRATDFLRRAFAAADFRHRGQILLELANNPDFRSLNRLPGPSSASASH